LTDWARENSEESWGHGDPVAEQIRQAKRIRLLRAMEELLVERGPDGVTVSTVTTRAKVSRTAFYDLFDSIHECVLVAMRERLSQWEEAVSAALLGERRAANGIRAALVKVVEPIVPYLQAQVVRVEIERAQETARARTRGLVAALSEPMLRRPLSDSRAHCMRACIAYLAQNPGASNTQIGQAIGREHRGQISRLLKRLLEAGLVSKTAGRPGHPNAWTLSQAGEQEARILAGLDEV
jgi:AcrR family transcriptional regulator